MKLLDELKLLLKNDQRLVSEDNLLKNRIVEFALKSDKDLIKLLLSNSKIKKHFFEEVDKILIFDKEKFMKFIDNKEFLPDSYTAFKNRIGLSVDKEYITENKTVVLSWPYKDCILEGGQEKEDEKRKEIFYNEILAPDEIDVLLEPKVFTDFKRVDSKGEHKVSEIKSNDNLIIKGNNLLVLHSLKKRFSGKIKLIYIDPPYNTGNDEFRYNDNFNHSTWLTFMKNRLEIAKELLSSNGVIFVQCDDNEQAYLNVLMDEIFQESNHLITISVSRSSAAGHKIINPSPINVVDYILMYSKDRSKFDYKKDKAYVKSDYDEMYSLYIENKGDSPQKWKISKVDEVVAQKLGYANSKEAKKEANFKSAVADFVLNNPDRVFQYTGINYGAVSKETQKAFDESGTNPEKIFLVKREKEDDIYIKNQRRMTFYSNKIRDIDSELTHSKILTNFWDDISWNGIADEGGVRLNKGKKPEKLMKRIIEITTNEGDTVLDYHMGSGTTCAVSHKMKRQYIGIEQLDYGENSSVERLKNVISGEQTGVSKAVNWKGGGEFIYCELKELNEQFVERIQNAKEIKDILKVWNEMKSHAFLSFRTNTKLFDENFEEFKKLTVEEQKKLLMNCLDVNNLYVNYSEIKDMQYKVSKEDIELNKEFYRDLK